MTTAARRRESRFAYARNHYRVPAWRNARVRFQGHVGRLVWTSGPHLVLRLDRRVANLPARLIVHPKDDDLVWMSQEREKLGLTWIEGVPLHAVRGDPLGKIAKSYGELVGAYVLAGDDLVSRARVELRRRPIPAETLARIGKPLGLNPVRFRWVFPSPNGDMRWHREGSSRTLAVAQRRAELALERWLEVAPVAMPGATS